MSKIGITEVQRVAALANIALSDQEAAALAIDLGQIVGFVEQLQSVNTQNIEQTSQVTGLEDVWREDVVKTATLTRDQLLANAPAKEAGYIKVRRVLG